MPRSDGATLHSAAYDEPYEQIVAALRAHADAERAAGQKAYLKSDRDFLGVAVPEVRREVLAVLRSHRLVEREPLLALAGELWAGPVFECRLAATMVLVEGRATLLPDDMAAIESWIRDGETWALVDELGATIAGRAVERFPAETAASRWR